MATGEDKGVCSLVSVGTLKLKNTARYRYYSGIVVSKDMILVIDVRECNVRLHRLRDGKLMVKHRLELGPRDICLMNDTEICVILRNGLIHIISIDCTSKTAVVTPTRTLSIQGVLDKYHGIVRFNDNLAVCGIKHGTMSWCIVSQVDGHVGTINKVCRGNIESSVTAKDNTIYISCDAGVNSPDNGVYVYDILNPSQCKYTYKHKDLDWPTSITVNEDGFIFVCNFGYPSCIHHLTEKCQLVTIFAQGIPRDVDAIFCDQRQGHLYATRRWSNRITIYKLEYPGRQHCPNGMKNDERKQHVTEEILTCSQRGLVDKKHPGVEGDKPPSAKAPMESEDHIQDVYDLLKLDKRKTQPSGAECSLLATPSGEEKPVDYDREKDYMEFKTEVAQDVLNLIKITLGQQGIDSLISSLKQLAIVDNCDGRVLVLCDSKHAHDVQKCVTSHYNRAGKEIICHEETTRRVLISGGNESHKDWLEIAFCRAIWSKNLQVEEGKLYLTGSVQMKSEVEKALKSMNNWYQEEFSLSSEEQHKADKVVALVKNEFPDVFIKQTVDKIGVLSANEESVERARHKVKVELGRIKITSRRRGPAKLQDYCETFSSSCASKDSSVDSGLNVPFSSFQSNQPNVDLTAKPYCTKEGLTVKVYIGDITRVVADCIVNAANGSLSPDSDVSIAISKAAGGDFDQEGKEYVNKYGPVPITQCCATSSGKLPYKFVIHAVGPRWPDYEYNEKERCTDDLKKTIVNCLIEANQLKMTSIAIPSLISGVPKPLCVQTYTQAVVEYSINYGVQSLKEIHFVDTIADICQLTQSAFEAELQYTGPLSYSDAKTKAESEDGKEKLESIDEGQSCEESTNTK